MSPKGPSIVSRFAVKGGEASERSSREMARGNGEVCEAAWGVHGIAIRELGEAGLLWAASELDDCVGESHLRLAQQAFLHLRVD